MPQPPRRRYGREDPREAADALFKKRPAEPPTPEPGPAALPKAKELVSLRIDRDVLDHFQKDGPGWQDRINEALRKATED